jgi:hypothetical protein
MPYSELEMRILVGAGVGADGNMALIALTAGQQGPAFKGGQAVILAGTDADRNTTLLKLGSGNTLLS